MAVSVSKAMLGYMGTNCYLVKDEKSGKALVVDPAVYDSDLIKMLQDGDVSKLEYILLTHGHFDHIMGAKLLSQNYGGKIVIHAIDEECFTDGEKPLLNEMLVAGEPPERADFIVNDGDILPFGDMQIKVIHTPGHTPGSVCYVLDDVILSGDTLFAGTVGRTDFPGGSMQQMKQSLKKLEALQGQYKVFPGHNEATTLEFEKQNNIYFK